MGDHDVAITFSLVLYPGQVVWPYTVPITIHTADPYDPSVCLVSSCTPSSLGKTEPVFQSMTAGNLLSVNKEISFYVPYNIYEMTSMTLSMAHLDNRNVIYGFTVTFEAPDDSVGWPAITQEFGSDIGTTNIELSFEEEVVVVDLITDIDTTDSDFSSFGGFIFDSVADLSQISVGHIVDTLSNEVEDVGYTKTRSTLTNRLIGFKVIEGPDKDAELTIRQVGLIVET